MKVAVGSDHRGIETRALIAAAIEESGHTVIDMGTHSTESCDYPDIAAVVARAVASGEADRGVLTCGTGIGVSIAANKINGIRAAVCHDTRTARLSRNHNDANILCLSGDVLTADQIREIAGTWFAEQFEGGRHTRRIEKIHQLENEAATS